MLVSLVTVGMNLAYSISWYLKSGSYTFLRSLWEIQIIEIWKTTRGRIMLGKNDNNFSNSSCLLFSKKSSCVSFFVNYYSSSSPIRRNKGYVNMTNWIQNKSWATSKKLTANNTSMQTYTPQSFPSHCPVERGMKVDITPMNTWRAVPPHPHHTLKFASVGHASRNSFERLGLGHIKEQH